jgi:uncharacterized protein
MASQLGPLVDSRTIEPHNHTSGEVSEGQTLRIVDVAGQQVADFVAIKLGDPTEYLDCVYTNWLLERWKWGEGDTVYTNHMNPLWTITEDTCGTHYSGGGFCSRDAREHYGIDSERGCRDTIEDALAEHGIEPHYLQSVSCFNVFMNVDYSPDGTWVIKEPLTEPGDHIDFRAEMDLLWAVSVCAWPETVNGEQSTPLRFELYDAT